MPSAPLKQCKHPSCNKRTTRAWCDEHRPPASKRYDRKRPNAFRRGYDARWERLRQLKLKEEPLCRSCLALGIATPATQVDHIIEKPIDVPAWDYDLDELQSLCIECHSRKTAQYRNRSRQTDGLFLVPMPRRSQ